MLTELTFCHKSSTSIAIDNWYYNRFSQWKTDIPRETQRRHSVFTIPTTFGIAHACVRMLDSRGTGRSICDLSRIIATRQLDAFTVPSSHYVSNNRIYVRSHLFAGTDSITIDLMTIEDRLFSQHRPPTILPFLLVGWCDCGWCAMTLAFHVLQKICRTKNIITIYFHIWM